LIYGLGSTLPQHGTVFVNADGTFTYTPAGNFNGTDTFSYTVTDGAITVTKTMTITVNPVNDSPTALDAAIATDKNTPVTGKLPAASDPDGDKLTYGRGNTLPAHGTVVVLANGKYIYTPAHGYSGSDTFTYTVTDGSVTIEKTVTVTVRPVNSTPEANDDRITVGPGESATINVLANDRDGDGDALRVAAVTSTSGHVSVNSDGTVKFVPVPGFSGNAVITYWVSDGQGGMGSAQVFVTVAGDGHVRDEPRPDKLPVKQIESTSGNGIAVTGAVLDAVRDIGGFGSIAGSLGVDDVILDAANRVESLEGLSELENGSLVVQTSVLDRARLQEIGLKIAPFGYSLGLENWDVNGLSGFSLRFGLDRGDGSAENATELVFETIVREKTLIVKFTGIALDGSADVAEYRVMQANGKPLPQWLGRLGKDMVAGRWPASTDTVELRVTAILTDGSIISRDVSIQTNTGEIKEIENDKLGDRPAFFSDEIQNQTIRPGQNTERLQQLFGR
jgi:VCBS repeat-containing protein